MARHGQGRWAIVAFAIMCSAVHVLSEGSTSSQTTKPSTCPLSCPAGQTCTCTCQWRSKNRAEAVNVANHGKPWLDVNATCNARRSVGAKRCRPGSRCTCGCAADPATPIAVSDTFTFEDPEGPEGPGQWTVSVLHNDMSADGTPLRIAPGSVRLLPTSSPGVSVEGIDEADGIITLDLPDGVEIVELEYAAVSGSGLVSAPVLVTGTGGRKTLPEEYPAGVCTKSCPASNATLCKNQKQRACGAPGSSCPRLEWSGTKLHSRKQAYCVNDFRKGCDETQQQGCSRCAIYWIMQACKSANKPVDCMLYDKTHNMVITQARDFFKGQECLMANHFLIMPALACTGVDDGSKNCRGNNVKGWWQTGFSWAGNHPSLKSLDWALFINQPEERGQQQMHIHIAGILQSSPLRQILSFGINKLPAPGSPSSPNTPKEFQGKLPGSALPYIMLAYYVDKNAWANTSPTHLAKQINGVHYGTAYNNFSYGVIAIPDKKNGGAAVVTVTGFSDREALDQQLLTGSSGKCQDPCLPITTYG